LIGRTIVFPLEARVLAIILHFFRSLLLLFLIYIRTLFFSLTFLIGVYRVFILFGLFVFNNRGLRLTKERENKNIRKVIYKN
jgi:hypothetical protein